MRPKTKQTIFFLIGGVIGVVSALLGIIVGSGESLQFAQGLWNALDTNAMASIILFGILILTATGGLTFLPVGGTDPNFRSTTSRYGFKT